MVVLTIAVGMLFLDTTVVSVALTSIAHSFDATTHDLQWVIEAYVLVMAVAFLPAGVAADRYGARRTLLVSVTVFSLASIACALANSTGWLVSGRAVQGLGAAVVMPASLRLIREMYPDSKRRSHAVALWSLTAALALAIGPVLGALVTVHGGWSWIFWLNVPLGILVVLHLTLLRGGDTRAEIRWDVAGQTLVALSVCGALVALGQGRQWGYADGRVLGAATIGVVAALLLVRRGGRDDRGAAPSRWLRRSDVLVLLLAGAAAHIALYSLIFMVPLTDQTVFGRSLITVGLDFLPLTMSLVLAGTVVGWSANHIDAVLLVAVGLALMALGMTALAVIGLDPTSPVRPVAFVAIGAGTSYALTPATIALLHIAGPDLSARASSWSNLGRNIGACVGVAYAGAFLVTPLAAHGIDRGAIAVATLGLMLFILSVAAIAVSRSVSPPLATGSPPASCEGLNTKGMA